MMPSAVNALVLAYGDLFSLNEGLLHSAGFAGICVICAICGKEPLRQPPPGLNAYEFANWMAIRCSSDCLLRSPSPEAFLGS